MIEPTILIVDDDEQVVSSLARVCGREKYQVITANCGADGLEILTKNNVHLVLADYQMPNMSGIEFLTQVKRQFPDTIRMMLTASDEFSTINQAINQCSIYKYIVKPWDNKQLLADIRQAFGQFELQYQRAQISKVFELTIEGLVFTSPTGEIEMMNSAFKQIAHVNDEVLGQSIEPLIHSRQNAFMNLIESSIKTKQEWHGELRCGASIEQSIPVWIAVTPIFDLRGQVERLAMILVDVSEQTARESKVNYLALHDELTELPNNRFFQHHLLQSIERAQRKKQNVGLLFMDLNGFKLINDSHGHPMGDWLLKKVAKRLKGLLRGNDKLCRVGGDEFTLVLRQIEDRDACHLLRNRIKQAFERPFVDSNLSLQVGVSIGCALYPEDATEAQVLIEIADQQMYLDKKQQVK